MRAVAPAGISTCCRWIGEGDEALLLPLESKTVSARNASRRRMSGAALHAARILLAERGLVDVSIPRAPSGEPLWPAGIAGSLAHDDEMAVAAIGSAAEFSAIGIDVEPSVPLPADISTLVRHKDDRPGMWDGYPLGVRLLFSAKEAVYKAVFPVDHVILDYGEIAVDLENGQARTVTGRIVRLAFCVTPRVVAIAFIAREAG